MRKMAISWCESITEATEHRPSRAAHPPSSSSSSSSSASFYSSLRALRSPLVRLPHGNSIGVKVKS